MTLDKILRQQAQPALQCGPIFLVKYIPQLLLHDPGGQFEIVGAQSVVQGFINQTPFREPGGRPAVQLRHLLGSDLGPQALQQRILEQLVIAIPLVALQGDDEQVGALHPIDTGSRVALGILAGEDRCTQRDAEAIEDRGPHQECLHIARLP